MISCFNLHELFSADNIGSLLKNFFIFKMFNLVAVAFIFRGFNFFLSGIVSFGSNSTSSSPSSAGISG